MKAYLAISLSARSNLVRRYLSSLNWPEKGSMCGDKMPHLRFKKWAYLTENVYFSTGIIVNF
jgi:hypothetical protein